ncbi:hypothetical protein EVAR_36022_1 [Eumeta japonica]|uniref:Uncharacterized protein n=1 Tax=Eumeta variegata TaxID=151549 RepID=A0A4C1WRR2_EUMVA|nr:hypothetical protein EVAR_36022_1 [Eumeta japonica]
MPAGSQRAPPPEKAARVRPRAVSAPRASPSGGRTAQRPARRKKYLNIRSRRSEPADVGNNCYRHQRAHDPRKKIPHRREPDGKINLFNRTRLTR